MRILDWVPYEAVFRGISFFSFFSDYMNSLTGSHSVLWFYTNSMQITPLNFKCLDSVVYNISVFIHTFMYVFSHTANIFFSTVIIARHYFMLYHNE